MNARYIQNKHNNMRRAAKKRGIEYALTKDHLREILASTRCFYTGRPLKFKKDDTCKHGDALTIDRVDHEAGYVPGNVVACSFVINSYKGRLENGGADKYPALTRLIIKRVVGFMRPL